MKEQIDLLVVNYNTKDHLVRLINELGTMNYRWKLYLADNGSTDGSTELIKESHEFILAEKVFLNENIGYARAINQMAAETDSKYLAAINADVWMRDRDVTDLVDFMEATPNLGVVGPKQRNEQGRITHAGVFGENKHPKMRAWQYPDPEDELFRKNEKAITVSGSAFFMPRLVWDEMTLCTTYRNFHLDHFGYAPNGGFPEFPHYYEETLFAYHCRAHGYDVWYNGEVSIGHSWRASTGADPKLTEYFKEGRVGFRKFCQMHDIECD